MATAYHPGSVADGGAMTTASDAAYHSYLLLHIAFVLVPIVAGIDKFFDLLGNWDGYLAPIVTQTLHISAHSFMMIVGVIEIIAALIVAWRPRVGAWIVAAWLWAIIVNLFFLAGQTGTIAYDVGLRDLGLSLGAVALARISTIFNSRPLGF